MQVIFASEKDPLSLAYLDLDHFKAVNDSRGHDAGDDALKRFFTIVRDLVGDDGDAFRIGGDEVTITLARTSLDRSRELAERIRTAVEAEFMKDAEPRVTTSIGVATFVEPIAVATATKFADKLLYASKQAGRNRVTAEAFVPPTGGEQ